VRSRDCHPGIHHSNVYEALPLEPNITVAPGPPRELLAPPVSHGDVSTDQHAFLPGPRPSLRNPLQPRPIARGDRRSQINGSPKRHSQSQPYSSILRWFVSRRSGILAGVCHLFGKPVPPGARPYLRLFFFLSPDSPVSGREFVVLALGVRAPGGSCSFSPPRTGGPWTLMGVVASRSLLNGLPLVVMELTRPPRGRLHTCWGYAGPFSFRVFVLILLFQSCFLEADLLVRL